uniref:Uncharacterized protein n=1 Tax=Arundo donax TaxID=35708 RepID=A0A0A9CYE3_ARUDO
MSDLGPLLPERTTQGNNCHGTIVTNRIYLVID